MPYGEGPHGEARPEGIRVQGWRRRTRGGSSSWRGWNTAGERAHETTRRICLGNSENIKRIYSLNNFLGNSVHDTGFYLSILRFGRVSAGHFPPPSDQYVLVSRKKQEYQRNGESVRHEARSILFRQSEIMSVNLLRHDTYVSCVSPTF